MPRQSASHARPEATAATAARGHLDAVDTVRALAVVAVLFHHIWSLSGAPPLLMRVAGLQISFGAFFQGAGLGVDIFFVLSGFLLAKAWQDSHYRQRPPPDVRTYLRRRMFRIVPAYYFVLLFSVVLLTGTVIPAGAIVSKAGALTIVSHATFTQFLVPWAAADGLGVFGSLWTLTHEMTFYLLLPFVVHLFTGSRWRWSVPVAIVAAVVWRVLALYSLGPLVHAYGAGIAHWGYTESFVRAWFIAQQFPAFAGDFALGILAANTLSKFQAGQTSRLISLFRHGVAGPLLGITGLLLVVWSFYAEGSRQGNDFGAFYLTQHIIISTGTTLLIAALVLRPTVLSTVFSWRGFRSMGIIGYSVFLWHLPVIYVVNHDVAISRLSPVRHFVVAAAIVVPLVIAISTVTYFIVEKPFMARGRQPQRARPRSDSPSKRQSPPQERINHPRDKGADDLARRRVPAKSNVAAKHGEQATHLVRIADPDARVEPVGSAPVTRSLGDDPPPPSQSSITVATGATRADQ